RRAGRPPACFPPSCRGPPSTPDPRVVMQKGRPETRERYTSWPRAWPGLSARQRSDVLIYSVRRQLAQGVETTANVIFSTSRPSEKQKRYTVIGADWVLSTR